MVKTGSESSSSGNGASRSTVEFKYTGVRKRKWGKYVSEIRLPNSRERIWLGSYDTAEKAARAFDAALFCLRGPNAKFNFPNDPPNIPGGTSLSPAEILVVSQQYGNGNGNYSSINDCSGGVPVGGEAEFQAQEMEGNSPSSNSEGDGNMNPIDWSFLDMLNSPYNEMGGAGNWGHVSDFELFHDPGDDVYLPPHMAAGNDNDENDDVGNENLPSFLWNFW
ncbi:ethylene-responsive transcription factor ERF017-like [Henckelia pumila]|uniref:ethylene-responsive transcription factor ERF017-like n=1 Tax=Henckelia pumila TaxID=405737 RepID=UPI003C6E4C10